MKRKWIAFVACAALVGTMALAAGCSNDPVEGQGVSGQSNARCDSPQRAVLGLNRV